jgi:hypothetical protein
MDEKGSIILILALSVTLLFHSWDDISVHTLIDSQLDSLQTNATHHLYPYLATAVTIAILVALIIVIATQGSRLDSKY